jgi:hypothetical protein
MIFVTSRIHSTELATAVQTIQSVAVSGTVENACCRTGM